jgi:hypothetical protein
MNNTIIRSINVTDTYAPLSATQLIGSVVVECPSTNAAAVYFQGDDDSDVAVEPGSSYVFLSVDLNQFHVKGTDGDVVNVIGGTW